jgi:hypothetical protein
LRSRQTILITAGAALAVAVAGMYWIGPVALSFYAAKKAPAVASVVPVDLKNKSVSMAPGRTLSYFGYEFEVPWNDLEENKIAFYPKDKAEKTKVDLRFRSGLRLIVRAANPHEWVNDLPKDLSVSARDLEAVFGHETMNSDYRFVKTLYEFTPESMNHWASVQRGVTKEEFLLLIKSISLPKAAETGIFNVQNQDYKGFQLGDPRVRQFKILVDLYSEEGGVEIVFLQEDYLNFSGVTQPEINRIVQSLRKAPPGDTRELEIAQAKLAPTALTKTVPMKIAPSKTAPKRIAQKATVVPVKSQN